MLVIFRIMLGIGKIEIEVNDRNMAEVEDKQLHSL
jgi:hypothetical protein